MVLGVKLLTKFSSSNVGQKFFKVVTDPKHEGFINNVLPTIESGICGLTYIWATSRRKEIPDSQRRNLQWQNVLTTAMGMTLGTLANRHITKYGNELVKHIDTKHIADVHKVIMGLKIMLPALATSVLMRFITPTVASYISSKIEDRNRKKLDIKA